MKLKTLISILLIGIIFICGSRIHNKLNAYSKDEESMKKIQQVYKADDSQSVLSENKDFRFWIKIDNTKIDYPVVQGNDNSFYLKHGFSKEENISGSIFLDYRVNKDSKNAIIYGHNMKNGSMFNNVELFKNEDFFNNNKFINITRDGKEYVYEVFSVYYLSGEKTSHLQTNFKNNDEFKTYLETVKKNSMFNSSREVNLNDIVTLSTCSYEKKNCRTVVHAQLVEIR